MFTRCFIIVLVLAGSAIATPPLSSAVVSDDVSVTIPAGTWRVDEHVAKILKGERFFVAGAGVHSVINEPLQLSPNKPAGFWIGTKLQGPRTDGAINALNALCAESLEVRRTPDDTPLQLGKDYLVSPRFALLGLGPNPVVTEDDVVYASYRYQVHRLDSIVLMNDGNLKYLHGTPKVAAVAPPEVPSGGIRLLNVFRPFGATTVSSEHLFFIENNSKRIETKTTAGRIPSTLKKLSDGEKVTIVCLGDSVTAGADIPDHEKCYVEQFRTALSEKFSAEQIDLRNISLGGSKSIQWLYNGNYDRLQKRPSHVCSFSRVLAAKPDLVTIEFVNDTALTDEELSWSYNKMVTDLKDIGAEVILITPHFTHPDVMRVTDDVLRPEENRPYVAFLHEFSEKNNVALADASSRWEASWKEGLPYITLLANRYNHPSPAGGRFFVQELIKCFSK